MIIKNGNVFQEDGSFRKETLYIRNHRLTEAFEATSEEEVIGSYGDSRSCGYPQPWSIWGRFF